MCVWLATRVEVMNTTAAPVATQDANDHEHSRLAETLSSVALTVAMIACIYLCRKRRRATRAQQIQFHLQGQPTVQTVKQNIRLFLALNPTATVAPEFDFYMFRVWLNNNKSHLGVQINHNLAQQIFKQLNPKQGIATKASFDEWVAVPIQITAEFGDRTKVFRDVVVFADGTEKKISDIDVSQSQLRM